MVRYPIPFVLEEYKRRLAASCSRKRREAAASHLNPPLEGDEVSTTVIGLVAFLRVLE
jgi:hypothetical protein